MMRELLSRELLADKGKGLKVETGEILFACFGAVLFFAICVAISCLIADAAQHRRRKLTFPGAEDYVSHGRMNVRKWIKTIGAPDMIPEQYDIAFAGGELPKDRYQRLALPMYNDSGKSFDPCAMPRRWLQPLGAPLRKVYLFFFWNDICKVIYKDCYWGARYVREWNQETEIQEDTPAKWLAEGKPCTFCGAGFSACMGFVCGGCCATRPCVAVSESTTNCLKSVADPTKCVVGDEKMQGMSMPKMCVKQEQEIVPTELDSDEVKEAYMNKQVQKAKENSEKKISEAQERAAAAIKKAMEDDHKTEKEVEKKLMKLKSTKLKSVALDDDDEL
jgi:hypothetical protein